MKKFILNYKGGGPKPKDHVEQIKAVEGVTVIDSCFPKILVVEAADEGKLHEVLSKLTGWIINPMGA
jgi:hypothetical protein